MGFCLSFQVKEIARPSPGILTNDKDRMAKRFGLSDSDGHFSEMEFGFVDFWERAKLASHIPFVERDVLADAVEILR